MKNPEYAIGAVWLAIDSKDNGRFTIIGPGSRPGYKLCRFNSDYYDRRGAVIEQEYSHKHLKRYARYAKP